MKIALVTWNFNKSGGIERCVFELANVLKETNEIHIFSTDENLTRLAGVYYHTIPVINKIFILKVISFFISSFFIVKRVNKLIDFDIIHLHNPSLIIPDVYTLHSVHTEGIKFQESSLKWFAKFAFRVKTFYPIISFLSKYNYLRSKHLVAISRQVKKEVLNAEKKLNPSKVSIIYHGVNTEDFKGLNAMQKKEMKIKLGVGLSQKVLLFVANEFKRKGLDVLLEALSNIHHLDSVILIIVGDSQDGLLNTRQAKELAKELGVFNLCLFVGKSDNVAQYFSIADLFVLPSSYEPLGMVYMEAMSAGVPILASRVAGISDLIDDGINGILISNSASEIAEIIKKLDKEPKFFEKIGNEGKIKIDKYSWKFSAEEYMNLYEVLKCKN